MNLDDAPAEDRQRVHRLRTLIERSKIYTSILADKLLKQQAEAKSRGEALDRAAESKSKRESALASGPTRKSSRVAAPDRSSENNPGTSPRKQRVPQKKKTGKTSIADYFSRKDLQTELSTEEALQKARKEETSEEEGTDVGVTAVTKPSASARQPE